MNKNTDKITWVFIFEPNNTKAITEAKIKEISNPEEYLDVILDTGYVIRFLALGDVKVLDDIKLALEKFKAGSEERKHPPKSMIVRKDKLIEFIEKWAEDFLDYDIDDTSMYEDIDDPDFMIYRVMDVSGHTLYFRVAPVKKGELYYVSLLADTGRVHAKFER